MENKSLVVFLSVWMAVQPALPAWASPWHDTGVGPNTEFPLPKMPMNVKGLDPKSKELEDEKEKTKEKEREAAALNESKTLLTRIQCHYNQPGPAPEKPKPEVKKAGKVSESKRRDEPDAKMTVNFATLLSKLDPKKMEELSDFIESLREKQQIANVHFIGNTDSDPIIGNARKLFADNYELSKARAKAVAEVFSNIFPDIETTYDGWGADNPVASNETAVGKAKNRRTEIRVYFEKGSPQVRKEASESESNTEGQCAEGQCGQETIGPEAPFKVTIDGAPLKAEDYNETAPSGHVDFQRCTDVALEDSDIQIHFDALTAKKVLNLTTSTDLQYSDEATTLRVYTNYREFIDRAEVRVFAKNTSTRKDPLSIIALEKRPNGFRDLDFSPEVSEDKAFDLVLRVYDKQGHFDETKPKTVVVRAGDRPASEATEEADRLDGGYGENYIQFSNIPVAGGTITVDGAEIPEGYSVYVMGAHIPVDTEGKFATQQILPSGKNYGVEVKVQNSHGEGIEFQRDLHIPENDWFLVGIADLILGGNSARGPVQVVTQDTDHFAKDVFVDGRLAFYLKGKIKGEYLLTASADTREGPVGQIFSNFLDKDPDSLFRRLDPDKFYPVYGDDSTLLQDAPTQGKFYVKLERDSSYVMWGNFRSKLTDTELAQVDRGLYGLNLRLETEKNAKSGERSRTLNVFAATPGTLQAREDYRGTGGSQIWLRHPDISIGSENVRVEIRDKDSGLVLNRHTLNLNDDYTINYIQGQLLLRSPLPSTEDNSQLIRTGSVSANPVFLVISYEYTPGFTSPSTLALGGRLTQWIGDVVKLGATGAVQNEPGRNQSVLGADALVHLWRNSHIKAEVAQTDGPGVMEQNSLDGGFSYAQLPVQPAGRARAFKVETALGLYDVQSKSGTVTAYVKQKDAGFSAPGEQTLYLTKQYGGIAQFPLSSNLELDAKVDQKREEGWMGLLATSVDATYQWNEHWKVQAGVRRDDRTDLSGGSAPTLTVYDFGVRNDAAAQLGYAVGDRWDVFGFGQKTLSRDASRNENDRAGIGGHARLSTAVTLGTEVSYGNLGLGAKADASYKYDEHNDIYLSYLLTTDSDDTGYRQNSGTMGSLVSGVRGRYDETTSVYYENRYLSGNQPSGLMHTFGLDLSPLKKWTIGFSAEKGNLISQDGATQTNRNAGTASVGYTTKDVKFGMALEVRNETNSGVVRNTYLTRNQVQWKLSPSWRLIGKFNLLRSNTNQGDFYDGDYTDGSAGLAYRPVANDRLNLLFKYNYYQLVPSPGQVDLNGSTPDFRQQSHVFSIDTIYDLSEYFSLGGKYAFAIRSLSDRTDGSWYASDAHLAIAHLDFHVVYGWDALLELRSLYLPQAKDSKSGCLLGVYKHLLSDGTLKIGVGYNFTDYSDNLTDLSYSNHGWFINAVGGI